MTARVLLRRAAELDLAGIEDWYEAQQVGLGAEFREAVDELFRIDYEKPALEAATLSGWRPAQVQVASSVTSGPIVGFVILGTPLRPPEHLALARG